MFQSDSFDEHEKVTFFADRRTGLRGIIAIHSSALGPAMGGCRQWSYPDTRSALTDVLRLSRGMSYKNAIAGLPLGGGKAVILRSADEPMGQAAFEAFGDVVQELGGRYITAEDVGVSVGDMVAVARRTSYVSGLPVKSGSAAVGGDPSPMTALGVFLGIRAAVRHRLGRSDLAGSTVAVQGLGNVGRHLCRLLTDAGAKLTVADIDLGAVERVRAECGATAVAVDEILYQAVDVVAPCALGAGLNEASIPGLRAPIIAGAANNQLRTGQDGHRLHDRDILYAPDYVINAGGIISVGLEYLGEKDLDAVRSRVAKIEITLDEIFEKARTLRVPTHRIADAMAKERLEPRESRGAMRAA